MCVPACVCVCMLVYECVPNVCGLSMEAREEIRSLGTAVTGDCEQGNGVVESKCS